MKKEFVIQRDGKDFVLYAGLLDLAHDRGLKAITTTLVQAPTELNGMTAIVHASVETAQGVFCDLGDASPSNVSRVMAPHIIRMASTRAKARALRDAVNVGVTALEELGDADEAAPSGHAPSGSGGHWPGTAAQRPAPEDDGSYFPDEITEDTRRLTASRPAAKSAAAASPAPQGQQAAPRQMTQPGAAATPKQVEAILRMAGVVGKTVDTEGLTRAQASELITKLSDEVGATLAQRK